VTVTDVAIRAENLGKQYRVGERQPYRTFREMLSRAEPERRDEWFWALSEVSFELERGEALGIIGRNGAGKSTLLKILSRITEPTEGQAVIEGRVGSLLEVGTGFHAELTGRENVLLNGSVLGMPHAEIRRKFDDIVSFADVERFIDTPVKRYSTGMRARLAFAVAAHLEPDILIVDEVLAVGDAEFQKKCMGKMGESARSGRTVLFVSHNMAAVESLCSRVIWLDGGRCRADGPPSEVISQYLTTSFSALTERNWPDPEDAPGNDRVRIHSARIRPEEGSPQDPIYVTSPFALEVEYWNLREGARLNVSLHVFNEQDIMVFNALPMEERVWQGQPFPRGLFRDVCHIPGDLLNSGVHRIQLMIVEDSAHVIHQMDDMLMFEVRDMGAERGGWYGEWEGAVRPRLKWETEQIDTASSGGG
jgi:lipopolysaccharide transport system ATP-binding protein